MLVEKARPGINLLSEFTLMIVGAFVVGLPMAVAIIWVCSSTCFPTLRVADIRAVSRNWTPQRNSPVKVNVAASCR